MPPTPRKLSLGQQYAMLRLHPLTRDGNGDCRGGVLTWEFMCSPGPLSREYRLRLTYTQNRFPKMFVVAPDLATLADGRELPHVYSEHPTDLCLFQPKYREWQPHLGLVETMVSWAILWLRFFEEWLISNDWKGGGEHPVRRNRRANEGHRRRLHLLRP